MASTTRSSVMTIDLPPVNAADGTADSQRQSDVRQSDVPRLAKGVQLLGEYQGSGYQDGRYLVSRWDQQVLLVPRLPYLVLTHLDGHHDVQQVGELVSAEHGRRLGPPGVRFLIEHKLAPLGLIALSDAVSKPPTANPLLA